MSSHRGLSLGAILGLGLQAAAGYRFWMCPGTLATYDLRAAYRADLRELVHALGPICLSVEILGFLFFFFLF